MRCPLTSGRRSSTLPSWDASSGAARSARWRLATTVSRLLGSLEERDLIRREPVSRFQGDQQFVFKHVLIQDVAYATLPRAARRERHGAVARFLETATRRAGAERPRVPLARGRRAGRALEYSSPQPSTRGEAGRRSARCRSTARRSSSCRRTTADEACDASCAGSGRQPGGVPPRRRGRSVPEARLRARTIGQREVVGRDVACDLVDATTYARRACRRARGPSPRVGAA